MTAFVLIYVIGFTGYPGSTSFATATAEFANEEACEQAEMFIRGIYARSVAKCFPKGGEPKKP